MIGSGAIGVEFASFYADLGVEVTLVEILPRILPVEDEDDRRPSRQAFTQARHRHPHETRLESLERRRRGRTSRASRRTQDGQTLDVERAILAVGVTGNVEELGLEAPAVRVERGQHRGGRMARTDEPGVYAIGDVVGPPWLAHKAIHEGVLCMEQIAGFPAHTRSTGRRFPGCTYSRPQIASVGLTERRAEVRRTPCGWGASRTTRTARRSRSASTRAS